MDKELLKINLLTLTGPGVLACCLVFGIDTVQTYLLSPAGT